MNDMKFLVDFMLGRLAKWLRIWGYDAEYFCHVSGAPESASENSKEIIYRSLKDRRIILTRDHRLSSKKAYRLVLIRSNFFEEQLKQLMDELGLLFNREKLFSRCTICNVLIESIEKTKVLNKVPPYIYNTHNEFSHCPKCERIYWHGTHLDLLESKLNSVLRHS